MESKAEIEKAIHEIDQKIHDIHSRMSAFHAKMHAHDDQMVGQIKSLVKQWKEKAGEADKLTKMRKYKEAHNIAHQAGTIWKKLESIFSNDLYYPEKYVDLVPGGRFGSVYNLLKTPRRFKIEEAEEAEERKLLFPLERRKAKLEAELRRLRQIQTKAQHAQPTSVTTKPTTPVRTKTVPSPNIIYTQPRQSIQTVPTSTQAVPTPTEASTSTQMAPTPTQASLIPSSVKKYLPLLGIGLGALILIKLLKED